MSEEDSPNINAVGLMCDIYSSLEKRRRGPAGKIPMSLIVDLFSSDVVKFVEHTNENMNLYFGKVFNDPNRLLK
jgi:hypothetical protein